MAHERRPRASIWRVLLTAGAALAPLLGMEGVARLWLRYQGEPLVEPFWLQDPTLGARMRPGYRGPDNHGVEVQLNSIGLRSPEVEVPKPAGRFRVVAMGDSVTYGHLSTEEETYARLLEGVLVERGVEGAEVVNAGVLGYSTYQGAVLLERHILALEPDVVLFAYMNNDRWDSGGEVHTAEELRSNYEEIAVRMWFLQNTALGHVLIPFRSKLLKLLLGGANARVLTPSSPLPPRQSLAPLTAGDYRLEQMERFRKGIPTVDLERRRELCHRVLDLADEHGFRLVFLHLYEHPYGYESLRRATELFAANERAAALDELAQYFAAAPRRNTSAAHYDLFANNLLSDIYTAEGLPPESRRFYHPRSSRRLALHLDVEIYGASAAAAAERGGDVIELRDLEPEHYRDSIHLSRAGHELVANRIAEHLTSAP